LLWMQQMKTLAQKHPEAASAQFSQFLMQKIAVRRIPAKLDDRNTPARLLPVLPIHLPSAEHGVVITLFAGGSVQIEIRFQIREQIAVRAIVRILPNLSRIAPGQPVEPGVFLEIP